MRDCESERVRSGSQLLSDIQKFFDNHLITRARDSTNHRAGFQLQILFAFHAILKLEISSYLLSLGTYTAELVLAVTFTVQRVLVADTTDYLAMPSSEHGNTSAGCILSYKGFVSPRARGPLQQLPKL